MNTSMIVNIIGLVVAAAEEVPSIVTTIVKAVETSASGTAPTAAEIEALFEECKSLNTTIQDS
ncbi:hypothetical protein PY793_04370 [Acetobacter fabarum]|uniref:hypothetical protein n=1 Tax=Acetobacter fabarum TaxID=483199 RepID=UPI00312B7BC8